MNAAAWYPDPAGAPGRLRWWDGQAWTEHLHDPGPPATAALAPASPLEAPVVVVGPPRPATPGCRVFELTTPDGNRLGRLVETSRGLNDSSFGAAMSRSKGWQHATTRELRGGRGYPELVLTWGPSTSGAIVVTLPDRREVGRLVHGEAAWTLVGHDGRPCGHATRDGARGPDSRRLSEVTPDGGGGWRVAVDRGVADQPRRSLVAAAWLTADIL